MADIAELNIRVDSSGVKQGTRELARLEKQGGRSEKSMNTLSKTARRLSFAAAGFIGALGIRELASYADQFTTIENKLKNVTDTTEELIEVQEDLFDITQRTRSDFGSTVTTYQRLAIATQDVGIEQERLLGVTQGLQQAFIVSGATAQEARNAMIQLAQGLASGQLRGEEFRAVSEQGIRVIRALTASMGLTVGQLRELAYDGKLTTEVFFDAFEKQLPVINAEFEEFDATIGQASTRMGNSFVNLVGRLDDVTRASKGTATALMGISDFLDHVSGMDLSFMESLAFPFYEVAAMIAAVKGELDISTWLSAGSATELRLVLEAAGRLERERLVLNNTEGVIKLFSDKELEILEGLAPGQGVAVGGLLGGATKPTKEYTSALEKVEDSIAKMTMSARDYEQYAFDQQMAKLGLALGATNPKILEATAAFKALQEAANPIKGLGDFFGGASFDAEYDYFVGDFNKEFDEAERIQEKHLQTRLAFSQEYLRIVKGETAAKMAEIDRQAEIFRTAGVDEAALAQWVAETKLQASREWQDGAIRHLQDYADEATNMAENVGGAFTNAFQGMEDALVEFVQTGKLEFSDLADSIIEDLIRIQVRESITGPISGAISGAISSLWGSGGSDGGTTSLDWDSVNLFHSGGVVGSGGVSRRVNPAAFLGAPRYHSGGFAGLAPNEIPAILKRNEEVLTETDPRHRDNLSSDSGGGDQPVEVHFHVSAVDGASVQAMLINQKPLIVGMIQQAFNQRGKAGPRDSKRY